MKNWSDEIAAARGRMDWRGMDVRPSAMIPKVVTESMPGLSTVTITVDDAKPDAVIGDTFPLPFAAPIGADGARVAGFELVGTSAHERTEAENTALGDALKTVLAGFELVDGARSRWRDIVRAAILAGATYPDFVKSSREAHGTSWEWREQSKGRAAGWYVRTGGYADRFLRAVREELRAAGFKPRAKTAEEKAASKERALLASLKAVLLATGELPSGFMPRFDGPGGKIIGVRRVSAEETTTE